MAALSNPTVTNVKVTGDRTIDIQLTSVTNAANYKAYLGSTEFNATGTVASNNAQVTVAVAAANGGSGNIDVIHVGAGRIPGSWPGVAYVVTALDSSNANESSGTTVATIFFSR